MIFPVKRLADLGFEILATEGTAEVLRRNGVPATVVRKHSAGPGPDGEPTIVGRILAGEVDLVVNTPHGTTSGGSPRLDGYEIRTAARRARTSRASRPCRGSAAAVQGIEALRAGRPRRTVAAGAGAEPTSTPEASGVTLTDASTAPPERRARTRSRSTARCSRSGGSATTST